ncbi:MAG: substrate-binding domain-containing protein [Desulfobacteraceae bacterium]|nr:substrate-binding domain-containing protein [Desulfobacteraceae bacterium]
MFKDKEIVGIFGLLIFVIVFISACFYFVYNDLSLTEKNKIEKEMVVLESPGKNLPADALPAAENNNSYKINEEKEIKTILKLSGSNTIGAFFAPSLAAGYLEKLGCSEIFQKTTGKEEKIITGMRNNEILAIEIKAHGSSTGFLDLENKLCDIGMASRKIKEKEVLSLLALGDMESFASEHVAALDGIAVIVHPSNPMTGISANLLSEIFQGKIRTWKEAGIDIEGEIEIYARDDKSGTFDTFKSLILKKNKLFSGAKRFESNEILSKSVSNDPNSIGFTGLPYIGSSKALAISEGNGAKILPTFFTVATEDYPLSRRLYFYTPSVPYNSHTLEFINFALSEKGQQMARENGFVDLTVNAFSHEFEENQAFQDKSVLNNYMEKIKGSKRLSLNFRFRPNSFILDNRALRDLYRVVDFLKQPENSDKKIILAGFTDSNGDYLYNYDLASKRTKIVYDELRSRGISGISMLSAGEEIPVASNDSESGRSKNRRVEIWIK